MLSGAGIEEDDSLNDRLHLFSDGHTSFEQDIIQVADSLHLEG
jgi:hypothetical protein